MAVLSRKKAVAVMQGLLAAVYLFCTPTGAVRLAIIASGHPVAAVTCQVKSGFQNSTPEGAMLPYHVEKPPVERQTDSKLVNWGVYQAGPFCAAKYWGYC